jgi:hypothetical protein
MSFDCFGRNRGPCLCVAILLGACALASRNAFADTNLVDNGFWVIDGTDDTATNPVNISITVNGHVAGSFSQLIVSYNVGGSGVVAVATIKGSGGTRLALPPPGLFGGTFYLSNYQDCNDGLTPPLSITNLDIRVRPGKNGDAQLKGRITNFTSLDAKDFTMKFSPPDTDSTSVDVSYSLFATRDICINQTNSTMADDFHAVSMAANYLSPGEQENNEARYVRITSKTCFFYGCVVTKKSLCESLVNTNGYLISVPRVLGNTTLLLVHTQPLPQNTPTLIAQFHQPSRGAVKPQGFVNASADPTEQNISLWGNWITARAQYRDRQRIGRFRYTLSVVPPRVYSCDDSR